MNIFADNGGGVYNCCGMNCAFIFRSWGGKKSDDRTECKIDIIADNISFVIGKFFIFNIF